MDRFEKAHIELVEKLTADRQIVMAAVEPLVESVTKLGQGILLAHHRCDGLEKSLDEALKLNAQLLARIVELDATLKAHPLSEDDQ